MKTRALFISSLFFLLTIALNAQNCFQCDSNDASGLKSSAFGKDNTVSGDYSFVAGRNSSASQNYSYVFGYENNAESGHTFILGRYCNATLLANSSHAIGEYINMQTSQSIGIGRHIATTRNNSIIIGEGGDAGHQLSCDVAHSLAISFQSQYPTLLVTGPVVGWPDFLNTGRVGIGNITDPQAKLHIKADIEEPAIMFLEPSVWNNQSNVGIWMGNQLNGINAEKNAGLVFKTEHFYLFNQGNMGIGTEEPVTKIHVKSGDIYIEDINYGIIMKSPDGTCWRGTLNDNGQLQFEALEICPEDAVISVNDPIPDQTNIKIYPNPAGNNIEIEIPDLGDGPITFAIMDGTGKILKSIRIIEIKTIVSIGEFSPGVYYGKVSGEGIYCVEKFMKY